ncbi:MAG: ABC transporter ATP-binding protein [Deltaproteobacteria bacterium]|nr:ABC transporter ATP-binding protein [Deltaproteobacteria bacterium]
MIEVEGLVKRFAGSSVVTAVDGVSFRANRGEVFGLLGPNGAGKTSTLRVLATLLPPDGGTVRVAGHDVVREPARVRAQLGYLSNSTGVYGRLTVAEFLVYFARLQGVSGPAARAARMIDELALAEYANVRCDRLSTGNRQKVSIARALVHDPPVLILDEPTLGLDVIVAQTFLALVERAKAEGRCVLYSTHVMSEAERLCDRIGILHHGRLFACDTLEALRERTGEHYLERIFLKIIGENQG